MPDTAVNRRKGTTAEHAASFGVLAETSYDTDLKRLVAHDGATPGGFPAAMLHLAQTFPLSQTLAAEENFFGNTTDPNNAIVFRNPAGVGTNTFDFNTNGTMDANFLRKYNTTPFQIELAASGNLDLVVDSRNVATGTSVRFLTNGIRDSGTQTLLAEFFDNGTNEFTNRTTVTIPALAATTAAGYSLVNTTAAAAGAQQVSPALQFEGFGWKTNAVAASQSVRWRQFLNPVQGGAAPISALLFQHSVNASAFTSVLTLSSVGAHLLTGDLGGLNSITANSGTFGSMGETFIDTDGSVSIASGLVSISGIGVATFATSGVPLVINAGGQLSWGNGVSVLDLDGSMTIDIGVSLFNVQVGTGQLGFFGSAVVQQDVVLLTNNVTAGGTADTLDEFNPDTNEADLGTDMVDIASVPNRLEVNTNFTVIRNDVYQLGQKVNQIITLLEAYGLSTL